MASGKPSAARRVLMTVPLIAAGLCVLGILPWLTAAQGDPPHAGSYSLGIFALVAYPAAMAVLMVAAAYRFQHGSKPGRSSRLIYIGLFAVFVVTFGAALVTARLQR